VGSVAEVIVLLNVTRTERSDLAHARAVPELPRELATSLPGGSPPLLTIAAAAGAGNLSTVSVGTPVDPGQENPVPAQPTERPDGAVPDTEPQEPPTRSALVPPPSGATLLPENNLPFDLAAVRQSVDALFARLAGLGGEGPGEALPLLPWLVVAGAVVAECARRWQRVATHGRDEQWATAPLAFLAEDER
jgi:hypothetical protein